MLVQDLFTTFIIVILLYHSCVLIEGSVLPYISLPTIISGKCLAFNGGHRVVARWTSYTTMGNVLKFHAENDSLHT